MGKLFSAVWLCAAFLLLASVSAALAETHYLDPEEGKVVVEMRQPAFSLEKISFNLYGQKGKYAVRIDRIDSDEEWVYEYFQISSMGLHGETDSVLFDIKANKSWISDNNIDLKTLSLRVYGREWETLPLTYTTEDDDFFRYTSRSPELVALFALTGEPVPVDIVVTRPCNGNGVCEPDIGEDRENCPDCFREARAKCVPNEKYCIDEYLTHCNEDGSDYTLESCPYGCFEGECIPLGGGPPTGMAVALNPFFILVIAVLLTVLAYLTLLVKRMRRELVSAEERKTSNEDVKNIVKRKR